MNIIKDFKNKNALKDIYGKDAKTQLERYYKIKEKFLDNFSGGELQFFSASGRSEIIGNHTDHNNGCAMAAGINLDAVACVRKRDDMNVNFISEGFEKISIDLSDLSMLAVERGTTASLIRGIAAHIKEDLEKNIGGFDAYAQSNVFAGSGLSSSAAIEVLIFTIFNHLFNNGELDNIEAAKTGKWAENNYFGKPCGLMDQTACALGKLVFFDFADNADPKIESIDFDFEKRGYSLIITDVKADHADLTEEYASIGKEMRQVAEYFGKQALREVNVNLFYDSIAQIRENCSDRAVLRAMHFFDENARVQKAKVSLANGDINGFLTLIDESGESSLKMLQNTFVSGSTSQAMVLALMLSKRILGKKGAFRVHGGGFGGTILAFVPKEKQQEYISEMEKVFGLKACNKLAIRPLGACKVEIE